MPSLDQLQERCLQLGWKSIAHQLDTILEDASVNSISYADFLGSLLSYEESSKKESSWNRRVKKAGFSYVKTLSEFDFNAQPTVDERRIRDLLARSFYRDGTNLLFLGPPGVGNYRKKSVMERFLGKPRLL